MRSSHCVSFFFQAEDGIRDWSVTGVQTCALPISRTYPAPGFTVLRNFSASRAVLLKRWAIRLAVIAQETPTLARDPPGEMSSGKPDARERQGGRQPAEPVDAMEQLGHGVDARQHAAVGQHEAHRRRAHRVRDLRKAFATRRRSPREDLEGAAGVRQAHDPERARAATRALAVVDEDGGWA